MKIVITVLTIASLILAFMGIIAERGGRSEDEKLSSLIFFVPAVMLLALDCLCFVGWAVYKLMVS